MFINLEEIFLQLYTYLLGIQYFIGLYDIINFNQNN